MADLVENGGVLQHRAAEERRRWQAEERDLERRAARLVEAIERGGDAPLGQLLERIHEIDGKLAEVRESLAKALGARVYHLAKGCEPVPSFGSLRATSRSSRPPCPRTHPFDSMAT